MSRIDEVSHGEFESSISEKLESLIVRCYILGRFIEKRPVNTRSLVECDIFRDYTESEKYFRNFGENVSHLLRREE